MNYFLYQLYIKKKVHLYTFHVLHKIHERIFLTIQPKYRNFNNFMRFEKWKLSSSCSSFAP